MTQELVNPNTGEIQTLDMTVGRKPDAVIAEATEAANSLKKLLDKKPNKVMMSGEQYLEFEDWQTVGKFYGLTVKVASSQYIEYGAVRGFEARAVVVDVRTGNEISAAEAMCLNDEDKWSVRAKYEWKTVQGQRVREKVGEEQVPLFQLKSMAQTRACAKALRNVLAWVVVLAGYKATPAEELTGNEGAAAAKEDNRYKLMKSRFPFECAECKKKGEKDSDIVYDSTTKKAVHQACFKPVAEPKPTETKPNAQPNPADAKPTA
jgi:hypothetical protein